MRTIREGSAGSAVGEMQALLTAKGFEVGEVDSKFGPATAKALRAFQAAHGLTVDGVCGAATWRELDVVSRRPQAPQLEELQELLTRGKATGPALGALQAAIKDIGKREDPPGSNAGPQIAHLVDGYREHWKWARKDYGKVAPAWCAMAASWWIRLGCGAQSWGETPMGDWFGGSNQWRAWAREHRCWSKYPNPGALLIIGDYKDAYHTGMVAYYDVADDKVISIEGNVSNAVTVMERRTTDIHGFINWWAAA